MWSFSLSGVLFSFCCYACRKFISIHVNLISFINIHIESKNPCMVETYTKDLFSFQTCIEHGNLVLGYFSRTSCTYSLFFDNSFMFFTIIIMFWCIYIDTFLLYNAHNVMLLHIHVDTQCDNTNGEHIGDWFFICCVLHYATL